MTAVNMNTITMTRKEKEEYLNLLQERERRLCEEKYKSLKPEKWQNEILVATKEYREIMMSKGNRVGGTLVTMICAFIWASGWYDHLAFQWPGRRFDFPTRGLIIGYSAEQLRGATQKILMGEGKPWGVGPVDQVFPIVPRSLAEQCEIRMSTDNAGCIDYIRMPHLDGGTSMILMMTQGQDFGTIMGDSFDWCIYDEFVYKPLLYSQVRTRLFDRKGITLIPGTPERRDGKPPDQRVISRFTESKPKDRNGKDITYYRQVSLYEAEHFSKEEIDDHVASLEDWEKPYRVYGEPVYGDQLVFTYLIEHKDEIGIDPNDLPDFKQCRHLVGLDWGMSDYGALVWEMIDWFGKHYLWNYEKIRNMNISQVASIIRSIDRMLDFAGGIPVVCGRDVGQELPNQKDKPISIREMLRDEGINMYPKPAFNAFTKGKSNNIEPGLYYMCNLMSQKKFFISNAPHMKPLWNEFTTCYFKDGKIPKRSEMRFDGIEGSRYVVIMDKYARPHPDGIPDGLRTYSKKARTTYSMYA